MWSLVWRIVLAWCDMDKKISQPAAIWIKKYPEQFFLLQIGSAAPWARFASPPARLGPGRNRQMLLAISADSQIAGFSGDLIS